MLWLGSRWKRGWTKSKFPSATWRSSKRVFWWGHFQGSIQNQILSAGVQGRPAVLLHGPREAGSIVGIPRASRLQTVWLLRQPTPHYVGVLLHGCAGEQYCRLDISRRLRLLILFLFLKVHETGESGNWRDPRESVDEQHRQGLRGVQGGLFATLLTTKINQTLCLCICKCCLFLGSL